MIPRSGSRPHARERVLAPGQDSNFLSTSQPETVESDGTKAYASPAEIAARHIRDALQLIRSRDALRGLDGLAAIEARLFVALEQLEAPPLHAGGFTAGFQTGDAALEPSADERAGMEWWNRLSLRGRRNWLDRSKGETAADAWACHKKALGRCPCGERAPDNCLGVECPRWPL